MLSPYKNVQRGQKAPCNCSNPVHYLYPMRATANIPSGLPVYKSVMCFFGKANKNHNPECNPRRKEEMSNYENNCPIDNVKALVMWNHSNTPAACKSAMSVPRTAATCAVVSVVTFKALSVVGLVTV